MNISPHKLRPGGRRAARLAPLALFGTALALTPLPPQTDAAVGARVEERTVLVRAADLAPSEGSTVLALPWGEGPAAVGLAAPEDGERRGPEAFAVAPDGRVVVLDTVNGRLLLAAPTVPPLGSIPLDLSSPRFLAVTTERIHVLDPDDDRRIQTFTWDGRLVAADALAPIEGTITGLFVDPDGRPLVEVDHDRTISAGLPEGDARALSSARSGERGRPTAAGNGLRLGAGMQPDGRPRVEAHGPGLVAEKHWTIDPGSSDLVDHLVSLDTDTDGRVILGMRLQETSGPRHAAPGRLLVTRLDDGTGEPGSSRSFLLAESLYAHLGQPCIVGGDGRVYAPVADSEGYRIVVHDFPEDSR